MLREPMNSRLTMNQRIKPILLAAVLGGMFILATTSYLGAQNPGESSSNSGDHGDNPVVGSLPVEVNPDMDLMFAGDGRCGLPNPTPILGLLGSAELEEEILDAGGVPRGRINQGSDFSIFGLVHPGFVAFAREEGRTGELSLKQWLNDAYLGGTISMASNVGASSCNIDANLTSLPLKVLCASTAPVVDAWVTVSGGMDSHVDEILIHIVVVGEVVTVSYIP